MAHEQAQAAKDKGNAAFKAGDYPSAIGHYTNAILADRNDPTYPLNRAAAYLKLGKNKDAERDCTTVLELSTNNIKGFFRRGQARVALGKLLEARNDAEDFSAVLVVEPANADAQAEMQKLTILIQQEKAKNSKSPGSLEPLARTTGRHVPINIIDSSGNIVQPYAAETEATRRGNSSIPSAESGMVLWDKDSPPPSTLFDFNRTWNTLSSCDERWRYLSTIEPSTLPKLCQTSLEPFLLASVLEALLDVLSVAADVSTIKERMLAYLDGFSKVPRFETVLLFLSQKEKQRAKRLLELLGVEQPSTVWKSVAY